MKNNRQLSTKSKVKLLWIVIWFILLNIASWAVYLLSTPGGYVWPVWVLLGSVLGIYGSWSQSSTK